MADAGRQMTRKRKISQWGLALGVPAIVLWLAVELTSRPEAAGRYAGAILELFGFAALAYGLHETVAQVTNRPGLRERVVGWLRKLMFWRRREGHAATGAVSISGSGRGTSSGSAGVSLDAPLERRVEHLERAVEAIRDRIEEVRQEGREGRRELKEEIGNVRTELGDVEEQLEDMVRRQVVSSLHWEATGLLWFTLGVIFGTWPGVIPGG